ncbi:MAG: DNA polymerase III subunit beta [Ectothiorhodospira sp.]
MRFSIQREALLKPLQQVIGAVEKRQTMPILGNVLIRADEQGLSLVATDLEVEWLAHWDHQVDQPGQTTVSARKLLDICRALPDEATIQVRQEEDRLMVVSGRSRFQLSTLPAADFPELETVKGGLTLEIPQREMLDLIERTAFAMAVQDVRFYLNGLMLEMERGRLRSVATDGHRLSLYEVQVAVETEQPQQVILPRKGVMELSRLLDRVDDPVCLEVGTNHLRAVFSGVRFTSKLIDGRFPDYRRVIPQEEGHVMKVDREVLRQALSRTAILSNEKYRGVRMELTRDRLVLQAHNPEQEEAEAELEVEYQGPDLEIGFNVSYLTDVMGHLGGEHVRMGLRDAASSVLVKDSDFAQALYVVMPIRL